MLGYYTLDSGILIENIVFLELLRRNFKVFVGKIDSKEITFIANRQDTQMYIQVINTLDNDPNTKEKITTLQDLDTSSRKLIITIEPKNTVSLEGIEVIDIFDFLLE